jgi:hypothetical protein
MDFMLTWIFLPFAAKSTKSSFAWQIASPFAADNARNVASVFIWLSDFVAR